LLGWWNGRHKGLKIPWGQPREGSSPFPSSLIYKGLSFHRLKPFFVEVDFVQPLSNFSATVSMFIKEEIRKRPDRAEADRFYNYPYVALESEDLLLGAENT
jgi:hypothetical protein